MLVVRRDDACHVRYAAVAQFQGVRIKYFVQRVVSWEAFFNDLQEFMSYVGRSVSAVGWVEPYDMSVSRPPWSWRLRFEIKFVVVTASFEGVLVRWDR